MTLIHFIRLTLWEKNIWYMYHTCSPLMESALDTVYGRCLSAVSWVGKRF